MLNRITALLFIASLTLVLPTAAFATDVGTGPSDATSSPKTDTASDPGVASDAGVATDAPAAPDTGPTVAPVPTPKVDPPLEPVKEPEGLDKAQEAWLEALTSKPILVSLGRLQGGQDNDDVTETLKARLKLLSSKRFSNREWKNYWEKQRETGRVLASLYEKLAGAYAERDPNRSKLAKSKAAGLKDWTNLAENKTTNQDVYLNAIQTERDAISERLEAAIQQGSTVKKQPTKSTVDLSPFEARKQHLNDLRQRRRFQNEQLKIAETELKLIDRQLNSGKTMLMALKRDAELAQWEHRIAVKQGASQDISWAAVWTPIAQNTAEKTGKIDLEARYGEARSRGLMVEQGLAKSQIQYRMTKIKQIEGKIKDESGFMGWVTAIWDTLRTWALTKGWKVIAILVLIWFGVKLSVRLTRKMTKTIVSAASDDDDEHVSKGEQRAETIGGVFGGITRIIIYAVAMLFSLEQLGVNTGPILGSVAILGLAISFGSQNLVKDVVTGFFILIENQYAVGDVVEICGKSGAVEKVNLRSTWLRNLDGTLYVIPNGQITGVANMTRDWARAVCHIGVGYDADLNQVQEIIERVGAEMYEEPEWKSMLLEAPTFVGVTELGDSAVTVRCMAKVEPGEQWALTRELNRRLKDAFDEAGIEIPFPQRVVWNKGLPSE